MFPRKALKIAATVMATVAALVLPSRAGPTNDRLSRLLDQYRRITTIHCLFQYVHNDKASGVYGARGSYEYWADGPLYRIVDKADRLKMPGIANDIRWNGELYQWFDLSDSMLMYSKVPVHRMGMVCETLPLLPFDFLAPSGEQETTRLTLDGIQGPDTQRRIAEVSPISADGKLASYKGGKYRNLDSTFTIRFGDSPAFLPARIVRTLSSGLVDGEIDFVSYEPVECGDGAVYLPKQIEMHTRGIGVDFGTFTFTMTEAELNKPIAPEIFTIDFQTVRLTHNMDHDDLGPMYPATNTSASATAASQPASAPGAGIAKNQDDAAPSELLRYGGAATVILGLLMLISIAFSMSRRNRQPEGR